MEMFLGFAILLGIFILVEKRNKQKKNQAEDDIETANRLYRYSSDVMTVYVDKKTSFARKAFKIREEKKGYITKSPDQLHYTGYTFGGVTSGSFHVEQGGYSVIEGDSLGTWTIDFCFEKLFAEWVPMSGSIYFIQLSDELFEEAKNDICLKPLILSEETRNEWLQGRNCYLAERAKQPNLLKVSGMSKDSAEYLIYWLGKTQSNSPTHQAIPTTHRASSSGANWTCKKCSTVNSAKYGQCKKCGTFRGST